MSWLDIFRRGRKSASAYDVLREIAGAFHRSSSGRMVNVDTAIQVAAVFACARVIGNGIAQVPFKLMQETTDARGRRVRVPAVKHPAYSVLSRRPNEWQTSFELRQLLSWHLELAGQAICFKGVSTKGDLLELLPIAPGRVNVTQHEDWSLSYEIIGKNGDRRPVPANLIWHIRGPSWNGFTGLDVLQVARNAIGLAMSTEDSQAAMHRNGVRPSGTWSVEGKLTPAQYEQLHSWIKASMAGSDNAGNFALMDRAAKWVTTQMTGVDAQHLETRREQIAEVCRFFGVFPIMAGYADKALTFASAEQLFLAHLVHCLSPRWTMYEQSADASLLSPQDLEAGYYFDFVEEGMIRGSAKDTKDVLLGYANGGLMTANEAREKLDLPPDSDPASDTLRLPVNVAQDPEEATPPDDGGPPA